jgi:hypothetical protein
MTVPDWVTQLAVAAVAAAGTAAVSMIGWLASLGSRVTRVEYRVAAMEAAMQRLETHQSETAKAMVQALSDLRDESRGLVDDMASAREKALETFVTKADIRDLIIHVRRPAE